jgi:DNA-directed RNA polymerase subunit RPC12/RpoP
MDFEAYCVKCRKKVAVKNGAVKETDKGRQMAQGICPTCGTKVTLFLPSKKAA